VQLVEQPRRALAHLRLAEPAAGARHLPPGEDVAADGEVREEQHLLVDHADPLVEGGARAVQVELAPVPDELSAVGTHDPREHAHERRLAGAVLPDERVRLALLHRERHALQRADGAEGLRDALEGKPGHGGVIVPERPRCQDRPAVSTLFFFFFIAGILPAAGPAGAGDPVFTTYAAPLHRSEYLVDQGYHLRFYSAPEPLALTTDTAGDWGLSFQVGERAVHAVGDYAVVPMSRRLQPARSLQPAAGLDAGDLRGLVAGRRPDLTITNGRASRRAVRSCSARARRARAGSSRAERGLTFPHRAAGKLSETPPAGFTPATSSPPTASPTPSIPRPRRAFAAIDLAPGSKRRFRFVRAVAEEDPADRWSRRRRKAGKDERTSSRRVEPYCSAYDPGLSDPARRLIH
jgi:hypothetical protein